MNTPNETTLDGKTITLDLPRATLFLDYASNDTSDRPCTVDLGRALSALFKIVADLNSETQEGYPYTLRDLLQECEATPQPGPADGYTLREVAADAA